jgi:hypothetical protein
VRVEKKRERVRVEREREREIDLEDYEDAEPNCYISVDQYNGDRRGVCNRRNVSFFLSC